MLKFYKKLIPLVFVLMLSQVLYASNTKSAELFNISTIDFEDDYINKYTFGNGDKLTCSLSGKPYALLMIDGAYITDVDIPIIENRSFLPVRQINDVLGFSTNWEADNNSITIISDNKKVTLNLKEYGDDIKTINNRIYISMRLLEQKFDLKVMYYGLDKFEYRKTSQHPIFYPAFKPIITIDNLNTPISVKSVEEAYNIAYNQLKLGFDNFSKNPPECNEDFSPLKDIEDKITNMKYVSKTSRFYLFEGPYPTMVDEVTGDVYVQKFSSSGCGIYIFNPYDPDIYIAEYYAT